MPYNIMKRMIWCLSIQSRTAYMIMKANEYSVIYSDQDIVVLNKKSGYLVASDRYDFDIVNSTSGESQ